MNRNSTSVKLELDLDEAWANKSIYSAQIMAHTDLQAYNCIEDPHNVEPYALTGNLSEGIELPAQAFAVIRM